MSARTADEEVQFVSDAERPVHHRPRRLADWLNPSGATKVHSLIDKVYERTNLVCAWERVQAKRGSGGNDGQSRPRFAQQLHWQLDRRQRGVRGGTQPPPPVPREGAPTVGEPGGDRRGWVPASD